MKVILKVEIPRAFRSVWRNFITELLTFSDQVNDDSMPTATYFMFLNGTLFNLGDRWFFSGLKYNKGKPDTVEINYEGSRQGFVDGYSLFKAYWEITPLESGKAISFRITLDEVTVDFNAIVEEYIDDDDSPFLREYYIHSEYIEGEEYCEIANFYY